MKSYVCTLALPDGNKIIATARANSLDEEVNIEWSGATDRLGQAILGKHAVGFLRWYLHARAQELEGQFEFRNDDGGGGTAGQGRDKKFRSGRENANAIEFIGVIPGGVRDRRIAIRN
jgi:hypothetical protein